MRKPPDLLYGVDERPPLAVTLLSALQHVGVISIFLIYPVVVFRSAGADTDTITALLAVGFCVLGIATLLQASSRGPIGGGYMCPATFTATYLAPSVLAAKTGGLSLVFGMTIVAGLFEVALARVLHRLRAFVPVEISGLVILLIGFTAGLVAVRAMLGDPSDAPTRQEWIVATVTLAVTVGLNIWGGGLARMLCALIGMACGYVASYWLGVLSMAGFAPVTAAAWIALPDLRHVSWSFDIGLIAAFGIAALAASMNALGTLTVCQRTTDADWVRPDGARNFRGVLADGLGSVVSGALGGVGITTSTSAVGLASATGVASRVVAYAVGAIFFIFSLTPKIGALLAIMPRAVMASALLFAACFIVINGLQVVTSRLLDARRTLVIGIGVIAGAAVEAVPSVAAGATDGFRPIIGSSLVFGTLVALLLNMVFRIGVRQKVALSIDPAAYDPIQVDEFLRKQGATWGARPDVVVRAIFGVNQLVEAVIEHASPSGNLELQASFDEFNLDVRVRYEGTALEFPQTRPSLASIQQSEDGARLLAGFLLRRNADRLRAEQDGPRALVWFHFDH
ncbi:MAG: solute carrier family 23 protein [Burkholderiales bacterium]